MGKGLHEQWVGPTRPGLCPHGESRGTPLFPAPFAVAASLGATRGDAVRSSSSLTCIDLIDDFPVCYRFCYRCFDSCICNYRTIPHSIARICSRVRLHLPSFSISILPQMQWPAPRPLLSHDASAACSQCTIYV